MMCFYFIKLIEVSFDSYLLLPCVYPLSILQVNDVYSLFLFFYFFIELYSFYNENCCDTYMDIYVF